MGMDDLVGVEEQGSGRHSPTGYPAPDNCYINLAARLKKPTQGVGILLGYAPDNNRRRNTGILFLLVFA
jgi:hypothetical protein